MLEIPGKKGRSPKETVCPLFSSYQPVEAMKKKGKSYQPVEAVIKRKTNIFSPYFTEQGLVCSVLKCV